ncbi:hypothetical protein ASPACDRAFT_59936 [Aspergillus aculeatus ATCC 16872]|uniref:PA14 domain-containing protein n=1 Tax=Aspergillus aculeatus (strain ATCC 16872 / CBS 172.66 / WB 5094) TaxID=690307 RepID=A0A1L9WUY6_ASPA1|nr:uncharacterized protein ASPACDRAFT_59936 [Aspergillus aculeatus ATCC 16872]OJK00067.1 hypothetical protein ASPACDRAFT_59936 [Aspergillus aculeatus ATCC 16872]
MIAYFVTWTILLTHSASALPGLQGVTTQDACSPLSNIVDQLKTYSTATGFCQSVLATTFTVSASSCHSTHTTHLRTTTPQASISRSPLFSYPTPEVFHQFPDVEVNDACKCLGIPPTAIPTRTTTHTPTTTLTACTTPPPCVNAVLQWAYYHFGEGPVIPKNSNLSDYNIDVAALKYTTPNVTGTTTYVNVNHTGNETPVDIYGNLEISDYFALDHRGYLYAETTGTYAVTLLNTDDVAYFWYNTTAYTGWNVTNWDMYTDFESTDSLHVDLVAGQYLPIRLVFANAQGGASLPFSITAPDGSIVLDKNSTASSSIVQYSCDRVIAPEFPSFDHEA